jgi:hypothetical protein
MDAMAMAEGFLGGEDTFEDDFEDDFEEDD